MADATTEAISERCRQTGHVPAGIGRGTEGKSHKANVTMTIEYYGHVIEGCE